MLQTKRQKENFHTSLFRSDILKRWKGRLDKTSLRILSSSLATNLLKYFLFGLPSASFSSLERVKMVFHHSQLRFDRHHHCLATVQITLESGQVYIIGLESHPCRQNHQGAFCIFSNTISVLSSAAPSRTPYFSTFLTFHNPWSVTQILLIAFIKLRPHKSSSTPYHTSFILLIGAPSPSERSSQTSLPHPLFITLNWRWSPPLPAHFPYCQRQDRRHFRILSKSNKAHAKAAQHRISLQRVKVLWL